MNRNRRKGLTLIETVVSVAILGLLVGLSIGAVQRVRAAVTRISCANNLRQIGLSLQSYHDTHQSLPAGMDPGDPKFPYMSWLARMLPYVEQQGLWDQAAEDFRTIGGPPEFLRHRDVTAIVRVWICTADGRSTGTDSNGRTAAFTHYLANSGLNAATRDGVIYVRSHVRFSEITDGLSQTLAVGERPPSSDSYFGWWYVGYGQSGDGSADYLLGVRETRVTYRTPTCAHGPYHFQAGTNENPCDTFHYWSRHPGGAHFLYTDGSVRFTTYVADAVITALATRAGNESVEAP